MVARTVWVAMAGVCVLGGVGGRVQPRRTSFKVDAAGYFRKVTSTTAPDGELFVPVGINYWPGSVGASLWFSAFPAAEVKADFELINRTGFNSIRVFLTWPAFEPANGQYNSTSFANLERMLAMARDAGLAINLSVFVGGMSGRLYWPTWVTGNIYSDPAMSAATEAFARKVAETAAPYADALLGFGLGNEMNNVDTHSAPLPSVQACVSWTHRIYAALKQGCPGTPVIPGNGDGSLVRDTAWPLGGPTGRVAGDSLDFHPYAVLFEPCKGDGLLDPLTHAVTAYDTALVRSFGPAFMQEWGTLVTGGAAQQDGYLRGILPAAWRQGANGFLWWCMRDFPTAINVLPYATHGKETLLGLYVGGTDRVKPGLEFLVEFARTVGRAKAPPPLPEDDPTAIGIYLPKHHYRRGDPANPGNDPSSTVVSGTVAFHTLTALANRTARVVRGSAPLPAAGAGLQVLVVASSVMTPDEIGALADWVAAGGRLLWHGVPTSAFANTATAAPRRPAPATTTEQLLGCTCSSGVSDATVGLAAFGATPQRPWNLTTRWRPKDDSFARLVPAVFQPHGAARSWTTLAGDVVAVLNAHGQGRVLAVSLPVEASISPADPREVRDGWVAWYIAALRCLEVGACGSEVDPAAPGVPKQTAAGPQRAPHSAVPSARCIAVTARLDNGRPVGVYTNGSDAPAKAATLALGRLNLTVQALASSLERTAIAGLRAVVIPSQSGVYLPDSAVLEGYVAGGGCVVWHGVSTSSFSADAFTMLGVAAADFRSPIPSHFEWSGQRWTMGSFVNGNGVHVELVNASTLQPQWGTATPLAVDDRGITTLYVNRHGAGVAVVATPAVELSLDAAALEVWLAKVLMLCADHPVVG